MNSSLQKALFASILAVGGAANAIGQTYGMDYDSHCIDPNNTAPYSTDFLAYHLETPLFGAGIGISGTVAYKECLLPGGSVTVQGRIGFNVGEQGSIQDDLRINSELAAGATPDVAYDNGMSTVFGMNAYHTVDGGITPDDPFPLFYYYLAQSGSGWSYARVQVNKAGAITSWLFGTDGMQEAFIGSSNRYMYALDVNGGSDTSCACVIDVLGDAARVTWELTNNTAATPLGLGIWYGNWVMLMGGSAGPTESFGEGPADTYGELMGEINPNGDYQPYVLVPGRKPLQTEERDNATSANPVPTWVDLTGTPQSPYFADLGNEGELPPNRGFPGYQVVNLPYSNVEDSLGESDQTPVDEFVMGDFLNTLSGTNGYITAPTFKDLILPDVDFDSAASFIQKWQPTTIVPVGQTRSVITYYRSIWGDSNYSDGYTAVVDTPKAQSFLATGTNGLDPNPYTIQVDVDNTGGFGQTYKNVDMTQVTVQLQLPTGMHAPGNPAATTETQYISSIPAKTIGTCQFQVQTDPGYFGQLPYTIIITPTPGATKTINGIINVAATPDVALLSGPNLITSPWNLSDSSWSAVLANIVPSGVDPQTVFQAFNWDPVAQQYIISTQPARGIGTWIVENGINGLFGLNSASETATPPPDEFTTGAPQIQLQPGWNLVGNPYNYSFPVGQLVGVPNGTNTALSYDDLVSQGFLDGSFAYYVQSQQEYQFINQDTSDLLPNYGYWIYTASGLTLNFPPIYDLFVRTALTAKPFIQSYNHWNFEVKALAGKAGTPSYRADIAYMGLDATNPTEGKALQSHKPPVGPGSNVLRSFVTTTTNGTGSTSGSGQGAYATPAVQYGQMMRTVAGKQTYTYSVYTGVAQAVDLQWPNLSTIPNNLAVSIKDMTTGETINPRKNNNYAFSAGAESVRSFTVTITPEGTVRESIGTVTTSERATGATKHLTINYDLAVQGLVTMFVFQGKTQVGTIVTNLSANAGMNTVDWPMMLQNGHLASGSYTIEIQATGNGGDTATKLVNVKI